MNLTASPALDNSWSEATMNYSNAPLWSVPDYPTYTDSVLMPGWPVSEYELNVTQDVRSALLNASSLLTEVLRVYPPLDVWVYAMFYSEDYLGGVYAPTLTVTYSYVSASISLPQTWITYGQSVTVTADTDPRQTSGTLTLQPNPINDTWSEAPGGTYNFTWTPLSGGTWYLRCVWSTAWVGGSYSAVSNVITITVGKASSSLLLYLSARSLRAGQPVTLTAVLSAPLSTGTLSLLYSTTGITYTQIAAGAPTAGSFTYTWTPQGAGTYYLRANWSGDLSYNASSSTVQTLNVSLTPTMITLTAPTGAKTGESIALTATLRDNETNPLAEASITFMLNATTLGTVTTGPSGIASLTYTLAVPAGRYLIEASYAGSATYQVAEESTTIIVSPLKLILESAIPGVPLFKFGSVDHTTDASGSVVIDVNSTGTYTIGVNTPILLAPGTRVVFRQWADGAPSPSRSILIDVDQTFSALTQVQFCLTTSSPYGEPQGGGWYDSNTTAAFSIQPTVDHGDSTRDLFTGWTGDAQVNETSGSIVMTSPKTVAAHWRKEFLLSVHSSYGTTQGEGWYDVGAAATLNITPLTVDPGNGTRRFFNGWTGDVNNTDPVVSVVLDAPKNVTASWRTEHFLDLKSDRGHASGRGWYTEGLSANVTVESSVPLDDWTGPLGGQYVFDGWTGDITSPQPSITVLMDAPKTLMARWRVDYTRPVVILGAPALVLGLIVALALRGRRPPSKQVASKAEPGSPTSPPG